MPLHGCHVVLAHVNNEWMAHVYKEAPLGLNEEVVVTG